MIPIFISFARSLPFSYFTLYIQIDASVRLMRASIAIFIKGILMTFMSMSMCGLPVILDGDAKNFHPL